MARECGECTLCCTLLPVPVLEKPANTDCVNCKGGCTIYETRPMPCRTYHCEWLKGEFPEEMRPDKTHVVFEAMSEEPLILALIEPGFDDALPKMTNELLHYLEDGKSIVSTSGFALIPEGSTPDSVRNDVKKARERLL